MYKPPSNEKEMEAAEKYIDEELEKGMKTSKRVSAQVSLEGALAALNLKEREELLKKYREFWEFKLENGGYGEDYYTFTPKEEEVISGR